MSEKLLQAQMNSKTLVTHPEFEKLMMKINFHNLSFEAGQEYVYGKDGMGRPILSRLSCKEKDEYYALRQQATIPRDYCGMLIKKDNSDVFRTPPKRAEEDPRYIEFIDNCTLSNKKIDKVMREALLLGQIEARAYLVADHTNTNAEAKTLAQARADGDRPFVRVMKQENVINWYILDDILTECVITYQDEDGRSFARYYNDEIVQDFYYQKTDEKEGAFITQVGQPIPHGYTYEGRPSIPVVILQPLENNKAQIEPLSLLQKDLLRWISLRTMDGANTLFTITLASGVVQPLSFNNGQESDKAADLPIMTTGTDTIVLTGTEGGTFQRVGADGTAVVTLSEIMESVIKDIYRTAGRVSGNPLETSQPQSGISKIFDQKDLASILLGLAEATEEAENKLISLIFQREYGFTPAPAAYERDFENPSMSRDQEEVEFFTNIRVPNVLKRKRIEMLRSEYFQSLNTEEQVEYRDELLALYPNIIKASDEIVPTVGEQEEPIEEDEMTPPEEGVTIEE